MFKVYTFHNNLFFLKLPKIFEYLVVERKICINFDFSF